MPTEDYLTKCKGPGGRGLLLPYVLHRYPFILCRCILLCKILERIQDILLAIFVNLFSRSHSVVPRVSAVLKAFFDILVLESKEPEIRRSVFDIVVEDEG